MEPELPAAKTIQPLLNDVAANEGGAAPLAINVAETMPADEADGSKSPSPQPSIAAVAAAQVVPTTPGHAVFTTVEEDVARRKHQPARSWTVVAGPLVSLALALAVLGGLGLYSIAPFDGGPAHTKISGQADADDVDKMRAVEGQIGEFITRFPDDSRTPSSNSTNSGFELDRMNRRLQLQSHRGGLADPTLLPVEVLYLEAMNMASSSPEQAIGMLESLIKLYSTDAGSKSTDDRRAMCVQLAERQLVQLREDFSKLTVRQLTSIREQLSTAEALAATHPDRARATCTKPLLVFTAIARGPRRLSPKHATEAQLLCSKESMTTRDRSHALFTRAKQLMPGGVNSPARAFGGVGGEPIFIDAARAPICSTSTAIATSTTSARGGR